MAIIINNTSSVKTMADNLLTETKKIESVKESINYILSELNEYWAANQEDQQTFYKGLQDNVAALETISSCNNEFSNSLVEYMNATDATSVITL